MNYSHIPSAFLTHLRKFDRPASDKDEGWKGAGKVGLASKDSKDISFKKARVGIMMEEFREVHVAHKNCSASLSACNSSLTRVIQQHEMLLCFGCRVLTGNISYRLHPIALYANILPFFPLIFFNTR